MAKKEELSLLVRQHPHYFVLFTEHEPQIVLNEINRLVQQSLAQLQPRYTCILCHKTYTDQLEAISHSHTHTHMQTRQKQCNCISSVIQDTSFYLYSCHKCPGTFPNKAALHTHIRQLGRRFQGPDSPDSERVSHLRVEDEDGEGRQGGESL